MAGDDGEEGKRAVEGSRWRTEADQPASADDMAESREGRGREAEAAAVADLVCVLEGAVTPKKARSSGGMSEGRSKGEPREAAQSRSRWSHESGDP